MPLKYNNTSEQQLQQYQQPKQQIATTKRKKPTSNNKKPMYMNRDWWQQQREQFHEQQQQHAILSAEAWWLPALGEVVPKTQRNFQQRDVRWKRDGRARKIQGSQYWTPDAQHGNLTQTQPANWQAQYKAIIRRQQTPDSSEQRHKFLDPKIEFRKTQSELLELLFQEYTQTTENTVATTTRLHNVLQCAQRIRADGVDKTPLLRLLGRLWRQPEYHHLLWALYKAFLRTPEAKMYAGRAELLLPAIAHTFENSNNKEQFANVDSLCAHICRFVSTMPEQSQSLEEFLKGKFVRIIDKYVNESSEPEIAALKIEEMASYIDKIGCYTTSLADSIGCILRFKMLSSNQKNAMVFALYNAFMDTPHKSERKYFINRLHMFFPLMLDQIQNGSQLDRLRVLHQLLKIWRIHNDDDTSSSDGQEWILPLRLRQYLFDNLHKLFEHACMTGNFDVAQQCWQIRNEENKIPVKFVHFHAWLNFTLHHWMSGNEASARYFMRRLHNHIRHLVMLLESADGLTTTEKPGRSVEFTMVTGKQRDDINGRLNEWKMVCDRLDGINNCYQDLMKNCQLSEHTEQRCDQILHGFIADWIEVKARI